jgi:hypothetical protein
MYTLVEIEGTLRGFLREWCYLTGAGREESLFGRWFRLPQGGGVLRWGVLWSECEFRKGGLSWGISAEEEATEESRLPGRRYEYFLV